MKLLKLILCLNIVIFSIKSAESSSSSSGNYLPLTQSLIDSKHVYMHTKPTSKMDKDITKEELNNYINAEIPFLEFSLTKLVEPEYIGLKAQYQLELAELYLLNNEKFKAYLLLNDIVRNQYANRRINAQAKLRLAEIYETGIPANNDNATPEVEQNIEWTKEILESILKNPLDAAQETRVNAELMLGFLEDDQLALDYALTENEKLTKKQILEQQLQKSMKPVNLEELEKAKQKLEEQRENAKHLAALEKRRLKKLADSEHRRSKSYPAPNNFAVAKAYAIEQARNKLEAQMPTIDLASSSSSSSANATEQARNELENEMPDLDLDSSSRS